MHAARVFCEPDIRGLRLPGRTGLLLASENGHAQVVKLLLDKGANPAFLDRRGRTPLHAAASAGHTAVAHLLLDAGGSADAPDHNGETPLMQACLNNHVSVLRLLLGKATQLNLREKRNGDTVLIMATARRQNDIVADLLERGADVNMRNGAGWSALVLAAGSNDVTLLRTILERSSGLCPPPRPRLPLLTPNPKPKAEPPGAPPCVFSALVQRRRLGLNPTAETPNAPSYEATRFLPMHRLQYMVARTHEVMSADKTRTRVPSLL